MSAKLYTQDRLIDRRLTKIQNRFRTALQRETVTVDDTLSSLVINIANFNKYRLDAILDIARKAPRSYAVSAEAAARHASRAIHAIDYVKFSMARHDQ